MAPTVREVLGAAVAFGTNTVQVTTSASTQASDLIVAFACTDFESDTDIGSMDGPGWTQHASVVGADDGGMMFAASKAAAGGTETVTWNASSSGENALLVYVLDGASGVDGAAGARGGGASLVAPSVSPTGGDDLLLCAWVKGYFADYSGGMATPVSMISGVEVQDPGQFLIAECASEQLSASGATGSRTATVTDGGGLSWAAAGVAVLSASSGTSAHPGAAPIGMAAPTPTTAVAPAPPPATLGVAGLDATTQIAAAAGAAALTVSALDAQVVTVVAGGDFACQVLGGDVAAVSYGGATAALSYGGSASSISYGGTADSVSYGGTVGLCGEG